MNISEETGLNIGDLIYKKSMGRTDTSKIYEIISFIEKKKQYDIQIIYPESFETKPLEKNDHWWWDYIVEIKDEHEDETVVEEYVVGSLKPHVSSWYKKYFEKINPDGFTDAENGKEEIRMLGQLRGWYR